MVGTAQTHNSSSGTCYNMATTHGEGHDAVVHHMQHRHVVELLPQNEEELQTMMSVRRVQRVALKWSRFSSKIWCAAFMNAAKTWRHWARV